MFDKQAEIERLYGTSNESVMTEIQELLDRLNLDELKSIKDTVDSKIKDLEESNDESIEALLLKNMEGDNNDES